jgi:hypothetical protein
MSSSFAVTVAFSLAILGAQFAVWTQPHMVLLGGDSR